MKKCTNCKCENLKDAKECTKCGCKFIFRNVAYKAKPLSIFQKFAFILATLICTLVGSGILYACLQEVILAFMNESASLGIILLNVVMFGLYLPPVLIIFFMAYCFYFIVRNS